MSVPTFPNWTNDFLLIPCVPHDLAWRVPSQESGLPAVLKRRRDDANDDGDEENITRISPHLYTGALISLSVVALLLNSACVDLDDTRQSRREHLKTRLEAYGLKSRPSRSISRPRGEAGRKSVYSNGDHRNAFTLKATLKHERNVDAEHYATIQV